MLNSRTRRRSHEKQDSLQPVKLLPFGDSEANATDVVVVSIGAMFAGASAGLNKPWKMHSENYKKHLNSWRTSATSVWMLSSIICEADKFSILKENG
jgi:hypothetical protein